MYIYGICKKMKIVEDIAVHFNGEIARAIQGEDNALVLGLWNDAVRQRAYANIGYRTLK